ncbi:hypothetical protein K1719_047438 [Acacia pycnantha]|nr:hypothetical protein K1719_047438 [Acacia pycnantha]
MRKKDQRTRALNSRTESDGDWRNCELRLRKKERDGTLISPSVALSGDFHDYYGNKDRCVTATIYNYTMQLRSYAGVSSVLKYNLTEALLFLSHFVGDAHQPLHLGFLGDIGNRVKLRWYDNETNLHQVWDDMIIGSAMKRKLLGY